MGAEWTSPSIPQITFLSGNLEICALSQLLPLLWSLYDRQWEKSDISSNNRPRRRFRRNMQLSSFFFSLSLSFSLSPFSGLISRLFTYFSRVKRPSFIRRPPPLHRSVLPLHLWPTKLVMGTTIAGGLAVVDCCLDNSMARRERERVYNKNNNYDYLLHESI